MASVNDRYGRADSGRLQRAPNHEADGLGQDGQGAKNQTLAVNGRLLIGLGKFSIRRLFDTFLTG
jgi:hypothetical protein